jgi:hypothetical protein
MLHHLSMCGSHALGPHSYVALCQHDPTFPVAPVSGPPRARSKDQHLAFKDKYLVSQHRLQPLGLLGEEGLGQGSKRVHPEEAHSRASVAQLEKVAVAEGCE